jgi:hypothetical protein
MARWRRNGRSGLAGIVLDDVTKVYDDGTEAVSALDLKVPGERIYADAAA